MGPPDRATRRRFLAAAAGAGAGGLAGCSGTTDAVVGTPTPSPTRATGPSLAEQGRPPTICAEDVVDLGIYAVVEPAFAADWSGVEIPSEYAESGRLADDAVVVGLAGAGAARAYPVSVLWHHEVVNDAFPSEPVLVTYCSLCRSGMVARRRVGGRPAVFGVSGQLWQPPRLRTRASEEEGRTFAVEPGNATPGRVRNTGNLVMFDRATGSYWSQILARAICGPRRGDRLEQVPSTATTWGEWRDAHPDTDVLLPPPHSVLMELPG